MRNKFKSLLLLRLAGLMALTLFSIASAAPENKLLQIMQEELNYNFKALQHADSAELYYMSYQVNDEREIDISAELGVLSSDNDNHGRYLDVSERVGSYKLDNTHEITDGGQVSINPGAVQLPLDNNATAIKMAIWDETDRLYKNAQKRYTNVLSNTAVKVEAEDKSDDFSHEQPSTFIGEEVGLNFDHDYWVNRIKRLSEVFKNHPEIERSGVSLAGRAKNSYYVSTEGSRIQQAQNYIRLSINCQSTASDGMVLTRFDGFDAFDFKNLPSDEEIIKAINRLIDELDALKAAPLAEPYSGPAILTGRAAGVFFHEIFGHRMEGHRQKSEREGQTFAKKVGEAILPEFISVYSDPTLKQFRGTDLRGYYLYDDEGIKSRKVALVENGILRNFLMSRSPIINFLNSNGHGRKQRGASPVSRQANLLIESQKTMPFADLKKMLIEECKRQNKPYGLIFSDISGGFTFTGRYMPQAFKVIPLIVYKVYVEDGREELIRGVDIVGTPLTSFSKIIMAGDDLDIFNGTCGAESGMIPVSAISPSLLVSEIEIERSMKGQDRPPLLPSPLTK